MMTRDKTVWQISVPLQLLLLVSAWTVVETFEFGGGYHSQRVSLGPSSVTQEVCIVL